MNEQAMTPLGTTGPEPLITRYRHWYDHERDSNEKMLAMMESVPESARPDARFARAVQLAAHLAACRENHLSILQGHEFSAPWWEEGATWESLRPRYARLETDWSDYLGSLSDETLVQDVVLNEGGYRYRWNREGQIFQLLGHAWYHRGQISLLVDQLGGETVDTDYADWMFALEPRFTQVAE